MSSIGTLAGRGVPGHTASMDTVAWWGTRGWWGNGNGGVVVVMGTGTGNGYRARKPRNLSTGPGKGLPTVSTKVMVLHCTVLYCSVLLRTLPQR